MSGTTLNTTFRVELQTKYINNDDGININNVRDSLRYLDINQKLLDGQGANLANLQHYSRRRLINTTEIIKLDSDLTNRWGDSLDFQDIKIGVIVNRSEQTNDYLEVTIKGEQYYIGPRGWRLFYEPKEVGLIEDSSSEVGEGNLVVSSNADITYDLILIGSGSNIIPGYSLWLNPEDGVTGTGGSPSSPVDGDLISDWLDQSSFGRNFTQATVAEQAIYRQGQLNGLPGLQFDGTDDNMRTITNLFNGTAGVTFIVFKVVSEVTPAVLISQGDEGPTGRFQSFRSANGSIQKLSLVNSPTGGVTSVRGDSVITDGIVNIGTFIQTGSGLRLRLNGNEESLIFSSTKDITDWWPEILGADSLMLGCRFINSNKTEFFDGIIGDIISYDSGLLTDTDIETNEASLAAKYGITLS